MLFRSEADEYHVNSLEDAVGYPNPLKTVPEAEQNPHEIQYQYASPKPKQAPEAAELVDEVVEAEPDQEDYYIENIDPEVLKLISRGKTDVDPVTFFKRSPTSRSHIAQREFKLSHDDIRVDDGLDEDLAAQEAQMSEEIFGDSKSDPDFQTSNPDISLR